ncbi:MAG: glycosyltransferase family 4 protein [Humibacter sp.]
MARILWVSVETPDQFGQGGQRRQYHQIASLVARGHDVTVLVPASSQRDDSIRRVTQVLRPRFGVRGMMFRFLVQRARSVIRQPDWDAIVVAHHESWWLLPDHGELSTPVLLDMHNVMSHWNRRTGRDDESGEESQDEALAVRRATNITTCSSTERSRLVEVYPEVEAKTFVAPLGIDPAEWPAQHFDRTDPVVALFGSWGWLPNTSGLKWFMTEVWPLVRAEMPDAVALVAGSGAEDVDSWPDGARFVGRVPDLSAFTAKAAVVAVPVIHGVGAALKFGEALASGGAVIATPDGANAFDRTPAFVSSDAMEWATWIVERLRHRAEEPAPAASRDYALHELTWDAAVKPIDEWLGTVTATVV